MTQMNETCEQIKTAFKVDTNIVVKKAFLNSSKSISPIIYRLAKNTFPFLKGAINNEEKHT